MTDAIGALGAPVGGGSMGTHAKEAILARAEPTAGFRTQATRLDRRGLVGV